MPLIFIFTIYLPFEELLLKWLPITDQQYLALRQMPDVLLLGLLVVLGVRKFYAGKRIPLIGGGADKFLALFLLWSGVTIILNPDADPLVGILNIKALVRYISLIYLLLLLNPSPFQTTKLVKWLYIAILVQIAIGLIQLLGGITMRDLLAPRKIEEAVAGISLKFTADKFEDVNDLMGTMGNTISFGYFMLIGLMLSLLRDVSRTNKIGITILILILIYLSGSKAIFAVALLVLFAWYFYTVSRNRAIIGAVFLALLTSLGYLSLFVNPTLVASQGEFLNHLLAGALNSRLGIMVYLLPALLFTPHNIVGFSPDKDSFAAYVVKSFPELPSVFTALLPNYLEDVYWAAIYVYYGLIGLVFWLSFLYLLLLRISSSMSVNRENKFAYKSAYTSVVLLIALIPLCIFNQALEVRAYSFYLWLFCGIALLQFRQIRIKAAA